MIIDLDEYTELKNMVWSYTKTNNIANRGSYDGNRVKQFVGLLGENVVKSLYNQEASFSSGFDHGIDLTIRQHTIDVKTQARTSYSKPDYVVNLLASQLQGSMYLNNYYIFTSINTKTNKIEILGGISKVDFKKKATLYKKGETRTRANGSTFTNTVDNYELPIKDLKKLKIFIP